ncbi:YcgL domain-containing protein [Pseudomaricurvus sp.]|uniref:YcgL domain-containing protein n=1 Tax=Pseudomaricurvus sp. TaxID=2004510 RepID=UPI003F6D8159
MKIICDIYRSPIDEEMYLYVTKSEALTRVPEALLDRFGKPRHVMTLLLQAGKKLARVDAERVMEQLQVNGYYLQMPPAKDSEMLDIHLQNTKMNLK